MPEQAQKLMNFTSAVIQEATAQTNEALRALEERKAAALHAAETEARQEALQKIHAETARVQAEAGREVSRHLMECKRAVALRREEIAREVFGKVVERIGAFVESLDYFDRLERQLLHAVEQFESVSGGVTVYLRPEDMEFASALRESVRPVLTKFRPGNFTLGGLIVERPESGLRFDGSYDAALAELSGHFAELFGLSLSDDLDGT